MKQHVISRLNYRFDVLMADLMALGLFEIILLNLTTKVKIKKDSTSARITVSTLSLVAFHGSFSKKKTKEDLNYNGEI
ncbi:MAG: hypothetical protein K1X29_01655 [Bdellovibrionales bacterium]|nr:hypothetical protein [Bdellovibrionales bacterium]